MGSCIQYNDAAFRALFPAYVNSTTYPEAVIQANWNSAILYISPNYGFNCAGYTLAQQTQAINLMTAHLMFLAGLILSNPTKKVPGMVTGATIDKINVTLEPPPVKTQFQWWLNLSPYGQQLNALLSVVGAGGFYVSTAPGGRSGFRFGGTW